MKLFATMLGIFSITCAIWGPSALNGQWEEIIRDADYTNFMGHPCYATDSSSTDLCFKQVERTVFGLTFNDIEVY